MIDRGRAERRKCSSRQHLVEGTDHILVVAFGAAFGLVVDSLPCPRGSGIVVVGGERSATVAVSD